MCKHRQQALKLLTTVAAASSDINQNVYVLHGQDEMENDFDRMPVIQCSRFNFVAMRDRLCQAHSHPHWPGWPGRICFACGGLSRAYREPKLNGKLADDDDSDDDGDDGRRQRRQRPHRRWPWRTPDEERKNLNIISAGLFEHRLHCHHHHDHHHSQSTDIIMIFMYISRQSVGAQRITGGKDHYYIRRVMLASCSTHNRPLSYAPPAWARVMRVCMRHVRLCTCLHFDVA